MRHFLLTMFAVLLSVNINGRNAVRAHSIYELMNNSEKLYHRSEKGHVLRSQAIPDTIANMIFKSDTIYVMQVQKRVQPGERLHEVWRYDGNGYEYAYDDEDRLIVSESIDMSMILEKTIAGEFTHKEDIQYSKQDQIHIRRFVRVSSTLFEFEDSGYFVDLDLGEVYK